MVNEAAFDDNASQWEMWRQDKDAYQVWMTEKIRDRVTTVRSHGFRYRGQYEEELAVGELALGGTPVADGIPGENIERKGRHPSAHMDRSTSIVTGVAEARAPNPDGRRRSPWQSTRPAGGTVAVEEKEMLISGSEAVAEALTLADIDVVTAYPIRPYDT